jgi:hypothetical protein
LKNAIASLGGSEPLSADPSLAHQSMQWPVYLVQGVRPPKDTVFCAHIAFCMPTITVNVDAELKKRMEEHPEINWSEVTRQAIQEKIESLEVMDELTSSSELTESDVADIADKINESAHERVEEEPE